MRKSGVFSDRYHLVSGRECGTDVTSTTIMVSGGNNGCHYGHLQMLNITNQMSYFIFFVWYCFSLTFFFKFQ